MSKRGRILEEEYYIRAAKKAANFIHKRLIADRHHLFHRYQEGEADITGHLDDYAFLIRGLLECYFFNQCGFYSRALV